MTDSPSGVNPRVRTEGLIEFECGARGEIAELSGPEPCHPDIDPSAPIRQKRADTSIAGDRRRLFQAVKVRHGLDGQVEHRIAPERRALKPEHRHDGDGDGDADQGRGDPDTRRPHRLLARCPERSASPEDRIRSPICRLRRAPARPRVQFRSESVNRAELVVEVAMDRHRLALLPPLDGGDVTLQICGDFLPRIQPVMG